MNNRPNDSIDPKGLDNWFGVLGSIQVMYIIGAGVGFGRLGNTTTSESCWVKYRVYKMGGEISAYIGLEAVAIIGGPKCGRDLPGRTVNIAMTASGGFGGMGGLGVDGNKTVTASAGIYSGGALSVGPSAEVAIITESSCKCCPYDDN